MTAVVLAGGPPDEVSALAPGAANKAFVPVGGRSLVARTLDVLRASPHVERIVVVAPLQTHGDAALADVAARRVAGETIGASLRAGLRELPPDELVLVTASDLPILSLAAIDEFVCLARATQADIVYACVERGAHLARFPEVPHTWARLRDGSYCGGGVVAIRPRALGPLDRFLDRLGSARKNPLRLAAIFGVPTLLRYALGGLGVADAARRGSTMIGVPVAAAVCTHPEIAVNVDRASDVALAERLVAS
ncbi:MAG: nucleotidyltransferase family protein [Vulcanimicrobiaceae bacterium]